MSDASSDSDGGVLVDVGMYNDVVPEFALKFKTADGDKYMVSNIQNGVHHFDRRYDERQHTEVTLEAAEGEELKQRLASSYSKLRPSSPPLSDARLEMLSKLHMKASTDPVEVALRTKTAKKVLPEVILGLYIDSRKFMDFARDFITSKQKLRFNFAGSGREVNAISGRAGSIYLYNGRFTVDEFHEILDAFLEEFGEKSCVKRFVSRHKDAIKDLNGATFITLKYTGATFMQSVWKRGENHDDPVASGTGVFGPLKSTAAEVLG